MKRAAWVATVAVRLAIFAALWAVGWWVATIAVALLVSAVRVLAGSTALDASALFDPHQLAVTLGPLAVACVAAGLTVTSVRRTLLAPLTDNDPEDTDA